mmetsp:Transcript_78618/g.188608  ORF Transcript_78618/g.188608 Transcript_78618/m.188608 type:complete len:210 (+) Transcript_78618:2551-3180(+)
MVVQVLAWHRQCLANSWTYFDPALGEPNKAAAAWSLVASRPVRALQPSMYPVWQRERARQEECSCREGMRKLRNLRSSPSNRLRAEIGTPGWSSSSSAGLGSDLAMVPSTAYHLSPGLPPASRLHGLLRFGNHPGQFASLRLRHLPSGYFVTAGRRPHRGRHDQNHQPPHRFELADHCCQHRQRHLHPRYLHLGHVFSECHAVGHRSQL